MAGRRNLIAYNFLRHPPKKRFFQPTTTDLCLSFADCSLQLITSLDPKSLKISKIDDKIYESFRKDFPDMKIDVIDEDEMKSPEGKQVIEFLASDLTRSIA